MPPCMENIGRLKDLIKDIDKDNLWSTFRRIYKNMQYEEIRLHVISKEYFKNDERALLDRENIAM
ncbi:hypothetical protein KPL26_08550 [Clostridium algidicarnis]|uniref:hypothetical protein n=1 Tax=Clostridium algidicarnis TaxID=37659 RepID=UPI001C0B8F28|nr:hypothetical protein [Clostridium algidicarnis]MBU3196723.1 hypothetical protein [Clostridium algidicarnis]